MKRLILFTAIAVFILAFSLQSGYLQLNWQNFNFQLPSFQAPQVPKVGEEKVRIVDEESVVIDVAERVSPSVVTIGIEKTRRFIDPFSIDPFDPFGAFRQPRTRQEEVRQDIGSGFIVSSDGLIVTNKHVVSDSEAKYNVVTKDDKKYEVQKIYRDPANDLAIVKISASGLKPVELGDSGKLKVGQFVIAIGTALGEFRHTVTTGVISGLGRGITAGSPFEGFVERLDNVIQTDAAINPGNSGGPLLNVRGQVIGVNTAVAASGQNIGFALPISVVKEALATFQRTGRFERPFIGVHYKMISRDLALLNEVPEGAYVQDVVASSPAEKSGIRAGDIITKIDAAAVREKQSDLATIISKKKVGDKVSIEIWREGETLTRELTLGENSG